MPQPNADVSQETLDFPAENTSFLEAWKVAITLAGGHLFHCSARSPEHVTHWRQLTPKLDVMRKTIANRSKAEACLIACMAGLYNAEEGQRLMNKAGATFGDMAMVLSKPERRAIAALLLHYRGW